VTVNGGVPLSGRFSRRVVAGLLFVVLTMTQSQSQVSAVSISAKPSLVLVNTIKVSSRAVKGKVEVTVGFGLAVTHTKAPLLLTEVKVGSSSCRAVGKAKKCVVKNVSSGKTFKVVARAKNRNGFGKWSKPVSLKAAAGFVWRVSDSVEIVIPTSTLPATTLPVVTTTTLPVAKVDLTRATVLGTSSMKLAKLEGLSGAGVGAARVRPFAVGDVVFNTAGIVALAQAESASQSGSKLLAVTSSGALTDGLLNGTAVVKDFYSAPNGNIYVVFESKVALVTGGTPCLLAKVEVSTGVPLCVDSTLDSIKGPGQTLWKVLANQFVQFDDEGAIYFGGYSNGSFVLRRYKSGLITDLVNDNIQVSDFLVSGDGRVVLSGRTISTSSSWLRIISPTGNVKNLAIANVGGLARFSDGNIYIGIYQPGVFIGVRRYILAQSVLEEKAWIVGPFGTKVDSYFSLYNYFPDRSFKPDPICVNVTNGKTTGADYSNPVCDPNYNGMAFEQVMQFEGKSNFVVVVDSLSRQNPSQLWQYFPTVERTNIQKTSSVVLAVQAGKNIVLSGLDPSKRNVLTIYNPVTKQETVVMDGSNEVEIYSMSYSQKKNAIMFSGLRFSDNKYVVGEVSLG
jgi:hypothetical protein